MKRLCGFLVAFIALVCVPITQAQPTGGLTIEQHEIRLVESDSSILVVEVLRATATSSFDGNITMRVPTGASNPTGKVTPSETGNAAPVPPARLQVQASSDAYGEGMVRFYMWDVGYAGPQAASFEVEIAYTVTGSTSFVTHIFEPAATLVVYATPGADREVLAVGMGKLIPTENGEQQHVVVKDAKAGSGVILIFQTASGMASEQDLTKYIWSLAGLFVGLFIMYVIVKQGWIHIQRPRKFEKGGRMESTPTLEARRRTLMAALRELEIAHDAKEIPDDAYAPLKEEYKAQAVRVMRSLDDKKDKPGS